MYKADNDINKFVVGRGPFAMIDVIAVHGSTPRDEDTWMLVSAQAIFKTIGGGQLEKLAIERARSLIAQNTANSIEMNIPLGPHIGQCCGGNVSLKISPLTPKELAKLVQRANDEIDQLPHIYIFGAGHVGRALAKALSLLPVTAILIDSRKDELDACDTNIDKRMTPLPEAEVRNAPSNSAFVILTHDHAVDFLIAREALARKDASYIGMIGSKTKRATFRNWLRRENGSEEGFEQLTCPIGDKSVGDKRPEVIAALAVADMIVQIDNAKSHLDENISNSKIAGAEV